MPIIRTIRLCPTACGVLPRCVGCGWLRSCGAVSWAVCTKCPKHVEIKSLIINIELVASCWFIFLQYKVLLDSILYECGIIVILRISYSCFIFLKLDREEHCKGRRLHAARSLLIVNLRRLCTRFHAPKDEYHFETGRSRQNSHDCHIFP